MTSRTPDIAIIGAGPSGCALACFLAVRGAKVVIFDSGKQPEMLVGESLVPAAIPLLRRLGIEAAVSAVAMRKPGVSLLHVDGVHFDFPFRSRGRGVPGYAYNIPRPEFDEILRNRAKSLGVHFVRKRATVTAEAAINRPGSTTDDTRELSLTDASLAAAGLGADQHPSLLVDATGRTRLFARTLGIPSSRGSRDDVAYFAHYRNFAADKDTPKGQVMITVLKKGWSWRIPLQDRMSVGIVIDKRAARQAGDNPEQRLAAMIDNEPLLASSAAGAQRISPVRCYSNYQLISEQGHGRGWVMVGDAFGFVDPMLSPGVFMALESASLLDSNIGLRSNRIATLTLDRYCHDLMHWHSSWQEIIEYLYDGRLLQMCEAGSNISEHAGRFAYTRLLEWYYRRIIGALVSGAGTRSAYNRRVLRAGFKYLMDSTERDDRHSVADR